MICSLNKPTFCINHNYPEIIIQIESTPFSQDSIPESESIYFLFPTLFSIQTYREKIIGFILWSPCFMAFMMGFMLWIFLTSRVIKVLERLQTFKRDRSVTFSCLQVSLLNMRCDLVDQNHNTYQNGIKFKCTQE